MQFLSVFLDTTNIADFRCNNADVSRTQWVCHMTYVFYDFFKVRYNCAKFFNYGMCTDFKKGTFLPSAPSVRSPKKAHPE